MTSFDTLNLSAQLLYSIKDSGFTEATEVQAQAIPLLLEGRDLLGTARTGGGKTAAYLLPLLQRLAAQGEAAVPHRPRALILAPTRELAAQIGDCLRQFSKGLKLFHTVMYGGTPFVVQRKVQERGVHIVVATPGRLMDHVTRRTLYLDKVECLVLDEADRMLDMGFVDTVKSVAKMLPAAHQTVMFSATMNKGVRGLATQLLHNPGLVEIGTENAVAATIDHRVMRVKGVNKTSLLLHLLEKPEIARVLVFTRTKAKADSLAVEMKSAGLKAGTIHGDLDQAMRQRVLKQFRAADINVLIATDVAARGIDVPDITHVINYDMPLEADSYVHRVGRTGRAAAQGTALSICVADEIPLLRQIERLIGRTVPVDANQPFHDDSKAAPRLAPHGKNGGRPSRSGKNTRSATQAHKKAPFKTASDGKSRNAGQEPRRRHTA